MERMPKSGEFYRHFKNKWYQVVTVAEHSESREKFVIYQALYGDFKIYARPLEMFVSEVDHEKYPDVRQKYRFEKADIPEKNAADVPSEDRNAPQQTSAEPGGAEGDMPQEQEEQPDAGLLAFLDADDWDMKYNILVSLRDKMTDKLVDSLAVALDVVIPEGPLDNRYEELKICLRTRQRYENQHLR